jgi:hypothetical protein
MALRSTQPLTEMSTRNISTGKTQGVRTIDNLTAIYEPEPRRLTNLRASMAYYRDTFIFFLLRSGT